MCSTGSSTRGSGMNASTAVIVAELPRRATRRLSSYPVIPLAIIAFMVFIAVAADVLAPHNPEVGSLGMRFRPPAWQAGGSTTHLLGTDHLGRDVLSRLLFGARVSLVVGFTAVIVAGILGITLGITAGYLGGWVDEVIMRLTDTWLALPALTFAIFLAAVMGPSEMNIIIVLACVYWTRYARVIRGEVLSLKEREFVRLAIIAGCSRLTIMRRHILPNVLNSAIVLATLMLGVVVVGESGSGKSTLALSIMRLLPPAARIVGGEVRFEGEDLLKKSPSEMRRIRGKRIAMILQDPMASLNPLFTVGDQVAESLRVHEGASRSAAWHRAKALLAAVRISAPAARMSE